MGKAVPKLDKKKNDSRVGKALFLMVMFILVLVLANRVHAGSVEIVGAILGFAAFAALFGGILSTLLDRLFLTGLLGTRTGLIASCMAIWVLVLAYLLTLRPDGTVEHSPVLRVIGATVGMCMVFWLRRRWQEKAAALR